MDSEPTEQSEADYDTILNALVGYAQDMLSKSGEYYPMGASVSVEGVPSLGAAESESEQPSCEELIEILTDGYRGEAHEGVLRAAGICYMVNAELDEEQGPIDTICISLDHVEGKALDAYIPYRIDEEGHPAYGDLMVDNGSITLFEESKPAS